MARKRKAPSSQQSQVQKPKVVAVVPEEVEEEEEETSEEESEEEESEEEEEEESSSEEEEEESSSEEEEENDEESKRATIRELLEPFGKDQVIDLLKEAATKDTVLFDKIVQVADSDPTHRKIFVHGIGWDATSDQLLMAFKPFGEIEDSKLITDKNTGRAKGYAFVLFKTRAAAKKALKVPQKKIGNRMVSCQLASAGPTTPTQSSEPSSWKVFVGNVGPNVNAEKLKEFFRKFGEIEEGPIGLDPATNKFRGFAVITYKSVEGYKKALEEPFKVLENCHLHCKKYEENHNNKNSMVGQNSLTGVNPAVADVNYGSFGATPAIMGANLNPAGLLMAQNLGIGLAGNAVLDSRYHPTSLVASGLGASVAGVGGKYGINSISPSMIESYGSQAALQGLGAYQSAQMGQSPAHATLTATETATTRAPTGVGSLASTFPSRLGR